MKRKRDRILGIIVSVIPIACIILIWETAAKTTGNDYVLPDVAHTLKKFFGLFTYSEFYSALFSTIIRSIIAFSVSFILAFIFAFISEKSNNGKRAVGTIIAITRALPTIAVVLLLVIWTNSNIAPVIVTMLVVLPTAYTNCVAAFDAVDKDAVDMCRLFKVSDSDIFKKVRLPQMTPSLLYAVGSGLSLNLKLMVAAEVISQTPYSMGYLLNYSKIYYETATMLALVIASVIIGLSVELIFNALSKKAGKWQ